MLTKTQLSIIGYLLNREEPQSIRGIAKDLKKSYTLVYNNIENLRKKGVIYKQQVGTAQIINLSSNVPTKYLIEAESFAKQQFIKKHKWVELFLKDVLSNSKQTFFILLVFGSFAKGEMSKKSDLDLLAIVPDKKGIKEVEDAICQAYTKVKKQVIVIAPNMFMDMVNKPGYVSVGDEARKHHIILYGAEQYHTLMKR